MLDVIRKKQFIKSLKKYRSNKPVLIELEKVVRLLVNELPIPKKYKDHELKGNFKGIRELHLKPDDLLLYVKIEGESIILIDIGNHANLLNM
ncbi:type II toxin-antitoxin system YafQ family toxin [Thiotrichales bacterium 19S3-7]|nr:type II toxin-antitoxin system YafQ family toxin [Thiotrichales bacterium 19S3-7]MCF6800735.1 type II toxin-antitoxin system YafQ family toxin [Thiotrichales bacterium 19S3-11]